MTTKTTRTRRPSGTGAGSFRPGMTVPPDVHQAVTAAGHKTGSSDYYREVSARVATPKPSTTATEPTPAPSSSTTPARRRGPSLEGVYGAATGKRTGTAGGLALGLVGAAIAVNYARGGGAQVRGWFGAKFLNRPYGGATSTTPAPAGPGGPQVPYAAPGPAALPPYLRASGGPLSLAPQVPYRLGVPHPVDPTTLPPYLHP